MSTKILATYLNDHLAGSALGLDLLQRLADTAPDSEKRFYADLHDEITADQETLKGLVEKLGKNVEELRQAAGWLAEKLSRVKLTLAGMDTDELGFFESHEAMVLGVEGKRMLWRALQSVATHYPEWRGIDFTRLEDRAARQRDQLEARRMELAARILKPN